MSVIRGTTRGIFGGRAAAGAVLLGIALSLAACTPSTSSSSGSAPAPSGSASSADASAPTASAAAGTPSLVPMQTASGGEFASPTGNITCEVDYHSAGQTKAYCQTQTPAQSVTLTASGTYTTCTGDQCLANAGDGTPTLAYGTATGVGPFVCESATAGVSCTADGKGFLISTSGVSSASGSSAQPGSSASPGAQASSGTTSAGFSKALTAWKAAANGPQADLNTYLQQAASDLKESGNASYSTAISELTYLASLPNTSLTSAQQAQAHTDSAKLDTFFGTPGLMS